ncbi:MAG: aldehyde reductase [Lewinella sp.]|nr:aldehyde reductase [Lewinella sp.]
MSTNQTVLLTGVTGFLGSHTTIQLLEKGYRVIGTLRKLDRAPAIQAVIARHTDRVDQLSFAEADLRDAAVWPRLMAGVDYVQHIASPFPRVLPKNDDELLIPARDGALQVLRAAAQHGVRRVVLTSSTGAIVYGKTPEQRSATFTESDWTDVTNRRDTTPYFRSKTMAERAAWGFIAEDDSGLELTTVCPGAILGPVLEADFGTSANMVIKTMDGSSPAIPRIGFDMVDVRSVADLLIRAMEMPGAAGQRYIASAGYRTFKQLADTLREAYPDRKIPSRMLPNLMVRLIARIEPSLKPILVDLGVERRVSNEKAMRELNWSPRPVEEAILACAGSLIDHGIIK